MNKLATFPSKPEESHRIKAVWNSEVGLKMLKGTNLDDVCGSGDQEAIVFLDNGAPPDQRNRVSLFSPTTIILNRMGRLRYRSLADAIILN
jgi:hypothetical protein